MTVDYDLVIIGDTPEAIYAAQKAVYLKARVALVQQPLQGHTGASEVIFSRRFTHLSRLWGQLQDVYPNHQNLESFVTTINPWGKAVNDTLSQYQSPAILSALGVDVIKGKGEFVRLPQQAFIVGERRLRSQAYLLATGVSPIIPKIEGLEEVGYLTTADLWYQDKLAFLPNQLIIISETPLGIELAQNLRRMGKDVTLVIGEKSILSRQDPEAIQLLQAHLEAEGIVIYNQNSVTQTRYIEGKKWLQVGNYAIESDEIILATQYQPNIEGLNLEGVGVNLAEREIIVNEKLQTTNHRIYVCGGLVAGYPFTNIAEYEAQIALKNALFVPWFKRDYSYIPYVIFSDPPLARVGMTEAEAKQCYGEKIRVIKHTFKTVTQAQILGETTGFCKLVVRTNGEILGGHIIGSQAEELIGIIAFAMQKKMPIEALVNLVYPFPSLSEIIQQTALQWQRQHLESNRFLKRWLENWFIWRRNLIRIKGLTGLDN